MGNAKSMKILQNLPDISKQMDEVDESLEESAKMSVDTAEKDKDNVNPEVKPDRNDIINIIDNEQYVLSEEKLVPNIDYNVPINTFMENMVSNNQKQPKPLTPSNQKGVKAGNDLKNAHKIKENTQKQTK